jgi:hypothetical protein
MSTLESSGPRLPIMTDESKLPSEHSRAEIPSSRVNELASPSQVQRTDSPDDISEFNADNSPSASGKFVAYTIKLPAEQLAALQSIWLELKRLYGAHSPDKSGMIQQAIEDWLKRWDGPERNELLDDLLRIRQDTRKRQYKRYF